MTSLLLALLAATARAEVLELAFEDLPRLVAAGNENAAGAESLAASARALTGHLGRSYLPTLEAEAGGERFTTGDFRSRSEPYGGVEARLNLFRGGRDRLEEGLRHSRARGSEADARRAYLGELTQARKAFWELVALRETAALVKAAAVDNQEHLKVAARRIGRGLAAETDRLEFEIYASQLDEEAARVDHEAALVEIRLAALLGAPAGTKLKTPEAVPHDHDDALLAAPFDASGHPEVASARAGADAAGALRSESLRWWAPSVDLYGGWFLYTLRDRDYLDRASRDDRVVGARLSLPLFDGLHAKAAAASFARQSEGLGRQARQRARSAEAAVDAAKAGLKLEHDLIHRAEDRIAQGQRYLTLTLDEYTRGVKNSIDVLAAAQRQTSFTRQYVDRRRSYQSSRSDLLALYGR